MKHRPHLNWITRRRCALADLDEHVVERYLRHRDGRQFIQPGDRAARKRWLVALCSDGAIAAAVLPSLTSHERVFKQFEDYPRAERGLALKSIVRHLPSKRLPMTTAVVGWPVARSA